MIPRRIVSLVPSLTEALFALGAGDRCVGATRFCVCPDAARRVPRVGGTKTPAVDAVRALQADLVLVSVDENRRPDAEALQAAGLPLFVTQPRSLPEIEDVIRRLGAALGLAEAGDVLADAMAARRAAVEARVAGNPRPRVLTLIWRRPWMTAGPRTFMADLVARAGGEPVTGGSDADWPVLDDAVIDALAPDVVLLPDEPYRFRDVDAAEWRARGARADLCDGQLLTWAGPRIVDGLDLVAELLHGTS